MTPLYDPTPLNVALVTAAFITLCFLVIDLYARRPWHLATLVLNVCVYAFMAWLFQP